MEVGLGLLDREPKQPFLVLSPGTEQPSSRSSSHSHSHQHSPVSPRTHETIQQRPSVLHNTSMKIISSETPTPSVLRYVHPAVVSNACLHQHLVSEHL